MVNNKVLLLLVLFILNLYGQLTFANLVALATQIVFGLKTPTDNEMLCGDVAPLTAGVPDPNGEFNAGDLSLIQQKIFGSVSF